MSNFQRMKYRRQVAAWYGFWAIAGVLVLSGCSKSPDETVPLEQRAMTAYANCMIASREYIPNEGWRVKVDIANICIKNYKDQMTIINGPCYTKLTEDL